jgi:thiamine-phosphate pyrophosphorylase
VPAVHHLPRLWLFTDPRIGDLGDLRAVLERLPRGAGVVLRDDADPERPARARLAARMARRRGLLLVVAGTPLPGVRAARHARAPYRVPGALTASVHSVPQAVAAVRAGARLLFASPLFPTRSHPGGRVMPRAVFAAIVRAVPVPVVALGGMTPRRMRRVAPLGAYGLAGIDLFGSPGVEPT